MQKIELSVRVEKEQLSTGEDIIVALCDELNIAGQGETEEKAVNDLMTAVTLWLETASASEVEAMLPAVRRQRSVTSTKIEVSYGQTAGVVG